MNAEYLRGNRKKENFRIAKEDTILRTLKEDIIMKAQKRGHNCEDAEKRTQL